MLKNSLLTIAGITVLALPFQENSALDASGLRKMIVDLGYEVKDLNTEAGKEKYELTITTDDFTIPVAAEVSPSKNYVWFTVNLGDVVKDQKRHLDLLKQNAIIQPNFFYVTSKELLIMGVPVDNRGINSVAAKRIITKLSNDVVETAKYWSAE